MEKNAIKEARQAAGLTRETVCKEIDIPPRTLQDWELGNRKPPDYVERLVIEKIEEIGEKFSKTP